MIELTDAQLAQAAQVLAEALAEYGAIHVQRSRDYGRGFACARTLLAEWAEQVQADA